MADKPREVQIWQTVGLCPLPPGWHNVYVDDDKESETFGRYFYFPCAALVLQELRGINEIHWSPEFREYYRPKDPPYETRMMPLDHEDYLEALEQDANVSGSNYLGLFGPGQTPGRHGLQLGVPAEGT